MPDLIQLESSALPEGVVVVSYRGEERLCRPYRFEVYFKCPPGSFELPDLVGSRATLTIASDEEQPFQIHGIVSDATLLHELEESLYQLVLVPELWQLSLTRHSRMYTKLSVPDVLKKVLELAGYPSNGYELRLNHRYDVEEHVCQYQESYLDFLHRWMEMEGIYYFFEQQANRELLVITDSKMAHQVIPNSVIFRSLAEGDHSADQALGHFTAQCQVLPSLVKLQDYDYGNPALEVAGEATVSATGVGQLVVFGGRFFTPTEAKRLAKIRSEELLASERVYRGEGRVLHLRTGYTFKLDEHPKENLNQEYLLTRIQHFGNGAALDEDTRRRVRLDFDDAYHVRFEAIEAGVQYRAPRETSWPRIHGYEGGLIDGEADSEYAQIDDHGRYAVRFQFDESDNGPGKASTYIRMAQPHGGTTEGWHFPLRKGTEVIISFLAGDPDRPVVAGVVPNAHTPSPVTSANHTTNIIQTGGRNRFELEDLEGTQRITLSTPTLNTFIRMGAPNDDNNLYIHTLGNTNDYTGGQRWDHTEGLYDEYVKGSVNCKYDSTCTQEIASTTKFTVKAGGWKTDVTGGLDEKVKGGTKYDVTGDQNEKVSGRTYEEYGQWENKSGDTSFNLATWNVEAGATDFKLSTFTGTVTGDCKLTVGKWDLTNNGDQSWSTSGSWRCITWGAKAEIAFAANTVTTIGITNDNFLGVKLESSMSAKAAIATGVKLEVDAVVALKESACKVKKEAIENCTKGLVNKVQALYNRIAGAHSVA